MLFFAFCASILPICGQDMAISGDSLHLNLDWQEQILQQIDIENLGEEAYHELIEELSELVVWSDTLSQSALFGNRLRQRLILSSNRCLNQRAGYIDQSSERQTSNKAYRGDPWHHSIRYRLQYGDSWQAGLSVEKDAGEAWLHQFPIFDSGHGYLRYRPSTRAHLKHHESRAIQLKDLTIGHYRLRMGCGLLINQGFSLGKQYISQQLLMQRSNQITPFASNAESGFMQGIAADLRCGRHLTLLPYFSVRQIDGTLSDKHILTALQTDGYHRTQTENSHRKAAWQWTSGARIGWRSEWFDIGLHATYTQLQYDYLRNHLYYNNNYFRGHELAQISTDYTARALGAIIRGELALDDGGALANITALQYKISDYWSTSLLYRYYDNKYRQLHASALSESSGMQGEQGITLNIESQLSRHWQLQGMIDYFHFSQPQYSIRDSISQGFETSLRALYTHRRYNFSIGHRIKHKANYFRHSIDGIINIKPQQNLSLRTQLRARIYNKKGDDGIINNSIGYAISQSLTWHCDLWQYCPFTLDGQACYFQSDDYDSRLYLTERNILYGFGLPMLYGEGLRYSLTSTIKIGPRINVDLKWAMTNYANRYSIGSGLQKINSNTQQDLWLQLRLAL